MQNQSRILGVGGYLPDKILTNQDLEKILDTSSEWIETRTGILQRHIVANDEFTSDMAVKASLEALNMAGVSSKEIDLILVATTTPDYTFPSVASIVQGKLGAISASGFDVQAVCAGFIYALSTAHAYIIAGLCNKVLVVGADTMSRIVNWEDRNTSVLFGDGAGAVVLSKSDTAGILAIDLKADGSARDILRTTGGVSSTGGAGFIQMEGQEVFKRAVSHLSSIVDGILDKAKLTKSDIDWLIPHQANIRIINGIGKKLGLTDDKVVITVDKHANTSAASIPLALNTAVRDGRVKKGDNIFMEAIGGGLVWGGILLKW